MGNYLINVIKGNYTKWNYFVDVAASAIENLKKENKNKLTDKEMTFVEYLVLTTGYNLKDWMNSFENVNKNLTKNLTKEKSKKILTEACIYQHHIYETTDFYENNKNILNKKNILEILKSSLEITINHWKDFEEDYKPFLRGRLEMGDITFTRRLGEILEIEEVKSIGLFPLIVNFFTTNTEMIIFTYQQSSIRNK